MVDVDWHMAESELPLAQYLARRGERVKAKPPRKEGDPFRGSSIGYMCPRQEVLRSMLDVWDEDIISPDLDFIFACGNGIHDALQQKLLSDILIGAWRCLGCGAEYGTQERPITVPQVCTGNRWNPHTDTLEICPNHNYFEDVILDWHLPGFAYKEIDMHMQSPIKLYSHPDGILWRGEGPCPDDITLDNPYIELLEIKSASWIAMMYGYGYGDVQKAPVPYHRDQAELYMYILGIQRGRILYVDKSGRGLTSSFTEHVIKLDRERVESAVIGRFQSVDEGIKQKNPELAERMCKVYSCDRSRACSVRKECWDR